MKNRIYELEILNQDNHIKLVYTTKLTKREVIRNKGKTINTFYATLLPREIQKYMDLQDRNIFFYEHNNKVFITSRPPIVEYQKIKVQSSDQISVPKSFFSNVDGKKFVRLTFDVSLVDVWTNRLGVLSMEVI